MHRTYLTPSAYRLSPQTSLGLHRGTENKERTGTWKAERWPLLDPTHCTVGKTRSDTWLAIHLSVAIVRYGIAARTDGENADC